MKTSITQLLLLIYLSISFIQNLQIAQILAKFNPKIKIFNFDIRLLLVFLFSTLCWKSNAQTTGSYEFFESFRPTSARATMIATDGWSFNTAAVTPATALANARTGNNILSFGNVAGNNAITPSLNNPNVFKFYYRSSSASNNVTFKVDWSANNFATAALGSVTGIVTSGTAYQSLSLNTSNFGTNTGLKFRITITATVSGAALFIDDVSCTSTVGSENNLIIPDLGSLTSYLTVPVPGGNAPLTPSKYTFYDQGGLYDNYNKIQTQTNFFTPTNSWDKVKITFNSFNAESSTNISVYNWDGVTATPLLATFVGTSSNHLPSPTFYTTLNPGNSLKVVYTSGATQAIATIPGYDCTVESISYLSISNLSASSGCVGTPLTINGTSLNNATAVTINGVAATINSNSPTQIVVTPAAGSVGTGTLTVTTPLGTVTYSANVVVNPVTTPTFTPIAPIISGATLNNLPTTSLEGITGTWSPNINNLSTKTYIFTANPGQCAANATMTIVVDDSLLPPVNHLTPGGKLEPIFDRFGNKYGLDKIKIAPIASVGNKNLMLTSTMLCSSGIFDLYFEAGSGMEGNTTAEIERRNVVCQVFSDLSNFINSPLHNAGNTTRVKIWVRDITQIPNVNPATLGLATGFYNVPSSPNSITGGILDNEVWKTIHAGVDSYTNVANPIISNSGVNFSAGLFYHGMMAINPNVIWNTDLSVNASTSQNDLYSVILHEVTHALGFASLIDFDGNSKLGLSYKYYSRYDTFLNYTTTKLISPSSSGCSMYDYNFNVDPVNLHPGCGLTPPVNTGTPLDHTDCTTAINFVGTDTVPVYTSSCFETASSLSHFEDECFINPTTSVAYGNNNYFVMSNANSTGATKRYLKPEERATLCDLGYNLNTQYGNSSQNSFYNYGGSNCLGISVAGINDGITGTAFSFIGNVNQPITITGILNNDVSYNSDYSTNNQNNLRFECLQDVYDTTASITATGYDINATITFISAVSGVHLLRYIPYDTITGQRGNITYIYVFVKTVNNCGIPDNCNLVINGDFEQHSQIPDAFSEIEFACNWTNGNGGNADYYRTDATNTSFGIPNNNFGTQNVNPVHGGNAYAGIYSIRDFDSGNPYNEIIATKLKTSLQPNTTYQLTFDVSLSDNINHNSIEFQAYIGTDAPNPMLSYYSNFPVSATGIFLENNNFSADTQNWETISITFTTGNIANQQYLYIGGLRDVVYVNQNPPIPNFYLTASYYYIDNVSLVPIGDAKLNLPDTVCYASRILDLSSYLQSAPPTGVFTGDGVTTSGTAPHIVYSFDPSSLSSGSHDISYTYAPSPGCPLVTITKSINVALCPQFNPIAPICQGATAPSLPANPVNIPTLTGTWSPATIDTSIAGTFTYTFTPTTGQSTTATGTITVTILTAPSAGTISGTTTIYGTSTTTLTPTEAGGTWTTNDATIATIDTTGVVTGVGAGTTTIFYTVTGSNGCTAAVSTTITVVPINSSCNDVTVWNGTSWSNGTPNTFSYLNTAVVFTANFDTTEDLYACTVLVTNGAVVTVKHIGLSDTTTANTLTVTNEVVVNAPASLSFEDDSSLVQINNSANSGNIKYERITAVNKFDYTYWSSPVEGQLLHDLSSDTLGDKFYSWNPFINNWVYTPPTANIMNTGQGYIIRGPQGNDPGVQSFFGHFIGVPHNGVYTTPVYNAATTWNLIGNPYPSGLKIDCFLSDPSNTNLGGAVYLWSHNIPIDWTGTTQQGFPSDAIYNYNVFSYTAYNRLGGVATAITPFADGTFSTNRPIGTVAAGQSFFIESSTTGTATFANSMRVGSQSQENSQFFKNQSLAPLATSCNLDERHRLWLYIRNLTPTQQFKETLVGYSPNATTSATLDRDYDAKTFIADPNSINIYSLSPGGGNQLAIQGRFLPTPFDTTDVVPIGYSCKLNPAASSNTLEIGSTDFDGLFATTNFYLRILQPDSTYAYHDLKASPYQFSILADVFNNTTQFALVFDVPAGATILKNAITDSSFKVTMAPNPFNKSFSMQLRSPIKDKVTVTIFDVLGKKLSNETLSVEEFKNAIFGSDFASGVYQAEITQGDYKETIKIIKN